MMTSGLHGMADPKDQQAAFLKQQDHSALLSSMCQRSKATLTWRILMDYSFSLMGLGA